MRGNVIDMAVGIIIGAAFGKIVDSLVKDIIMPPIGLLLGKVDFTNLFVVLKKGPDFAGPYVSLAQATDAGAITLNLGNFLNAVISFTIVAFAVFVLIKAINELQAKMLKQEAAGNMRCSFSEKTRKLWNGWKRSSVLILRTKVYTMTRHACWPEWDVCRSL